MSNARRVASTGTLASRAIPGIVPITLPCWSASASSVTHTANALDMIELTYDGTSYHGVSRLNMS
jgi:hypothetical protein